MASYQSDEFKRQRNVSIRAEPQKTSRLAWASLIIGLLFFVPLLPAGAVLLGLFAARSIHYSKDRKGAGLAYAGASLGAIFLAVQVFIGYQGVQAVRAVEDGPSEALTLGFAGNTVGFRDSFHGLGAGAKDSEITVFLDELRRRYGGLLEVRFDEEAGDRPPSAGAGVYPYVAHFTEVSVKAEVRIIFNDSTTGEWFVNKIGQMVIVDEERGNLVFPIGDDPDGSLVRAPSTN